MEGLTVNSSNSKPRRPRSPSLAAESLEKREMMTGGVGDTFAILPAAIKTANGHTSVSFNLDPKLFTDKGNKPFVLGIDVAGNSTSTAQPVVESVTTNTGKTLSVQHAAFDPKVQRTGVQADNKLSSAALVTIPGLPSAHDKSFTYKVNVKAVDKTSGNILVGFYLPGDATGAGTVNQASINATQYAMGTDANDTTGKYTFDADANRDGKVDQLDLALAKKNLGISTVVSPVIAANLSPTGIADQKNRVSSVPNVTVTGTATPGATIIYSAPNMPTATAVASSTGNYTVPLQLAVGSNSYQVTASDPFMQKISGSIAAITYTPGALTVVSTAATTSTAASTAAATTNPATLAQPTTTSTATAAPAATATKTA